MVGLHYPDHLLFNKHFFIKTFFLSFSTWYIFYQLLFIPDMSVFFLSIFNHPKILFFLKKMNKTLVFSIFHLLFKIKHHPTSSKKQNEKLFFCIFFRNSKYIFCFDKSQIFRHKIYQHKNRKAFFSTFLTENHDTRVSALLSTCKRNVRTDVSFHVS